MGRTTMPGIYRDKRGTWRVDKVSNGIRLQERFGTDYGEAESWLIFQLEQIRKAKVYGIRPRRTFDQAAAKYVMDHQDKLSLETEIYMLESVMPFVGHLYLDQIHDGTLQAYIQARKTPTTTKTKTGKERIKPAAKNKTVNLALGVVRRILNLAARKWRDENNLTWLESAPLLSMLPLTDQREPEPLTWQGQRILMPLLPMHLASMALFDLNTGARDDVVCNLQWAWEIQIPDLETSVFRVPREFVKGRKQDRILVLNRVAKSIIEAQRGKHEQYVFVYRNAPIGTMNNTAWQNARRKAGFPGLHVHDLRHTVGMRLREAGVAEGTIADVLWHKRDSMTAHYSVGQVKEVWDALQLICDEKNRHNKSLAMLARETSPSKVPTQRKNG